MYLPPQSNWRPSGYSFVSSDAVTLPVQNKNPTSLLYGIAATNCALVGKHRPPLLSGTVPLAWDLLGVGNLEVVSRFQYGVLAFQFRPSISLPVVFCKQQFPNASMLPGSDPTMQQFVCPPTSNFHTVSGHTVPSSVTWSSGMQMVVFALLSHIGTYPGPHDVSRQLSMASWVPVFFANHDNNVSSAPPLVTGVRIWL